MITLRERLVKVGAKIVRHGRSITYRMSEMIVPRALFQKILSAIRAPRGGTMLTARTLTDRQANQ